MTTAENQQNENGNTANAHKMESSCGCGSGTQHKNKDQHENSYQSPMNCEGNKTYSLPGECPVCKMQLVLVGQDEPKIRIE